MKKLFSYVILVALLSAPIGNAERTTEKPFTVYLPFVEYSDMNFAHYTIITPDGVSLDLGDAGFTVGIGDIQDGMGLPPVDHKTWNLYNNPGGFLRSMQVGQRMVTITATLNADCLQSLHDLRNRLWQVVRWNRTLSNPPDPARLRYTLNGKSADLYVYYAGDVTGRAGESNTTQTVGIRLMAYDPLWYGESNDYSLALTSNLPISYIVGKISSVWNNMGNNGTPTVRTILPSPDGDTIYIGGNFQNWAGIPNANFVAKYTISTNMWSALGTGISGAMVAPIVHCLVIDPSGNNLYAGGRFDTAGGVASLNIAKWDGVAWQAINSGMDPLADRVYAIEIDHLGNLYVGGYFTNAGGGVVNNIAYFDGTTWSDLGGGATGGGPAVRSIKIGADGSVYVGGEFISMGGVLVNYIARMDRSGVWHDMAGGTSVPGIYGSPDVFSVAIRGDGTVIICGTFHVAGSATVNFVAQWNGTSWLPLSSGMDDLVYNLGIAPNGDLIACGGFTQAGGKGVTNGVAVWNGTSWNSIDILLPAATDVFYVAYSVLDDLFIAPDVSGISVAASEASNVVTDGDYETYPIFTITGPGLISEIINETSGEQLNLNINVNKGEIITIDLSPGVKSITSSWPSRPGNLGGLLGTWSIHPEPIAPLGSNALSVFISGALPVAEGDDDNQLSGWGNITGISCSNTDPRGIMVAAIISDGAGFYHVWIYIDTPTTHGVAHTASYNAPGVQALIPENDSGLGGTVTIDAVVAADNAIVVFFPTVCMSYYNRHLSIDHAMQ
jgi:hypothetical protein